MASVDIEIDDGEIDTLFESIEEAEGVVEFPADYAVYVEYPTSYADGPPYKPIYRWVKREWSNLDDGLKEAARSKGTEQNSPEHIKEVAWMVRQSINETGTDGVYFGGRTISEAEGGRAEAIASQYEGSGDPEAPRKIIRDLTAWMYDNSTEIVREEAYSTGYLFESARWDIGDGVISDE